VQEQGKLAERTRRSAPNVWSIRANPDKARSRDLAIFNWRSTASFVGCDVEKSSSMHIAASGCTADQQRSQKETPGGQSDSGRQNRPARPLMTI
jgi:hypothetical protein